MDRNAIAHELGKLGREDFRCMARMARDLARIEANRARRCELLTAVARAPETGLAPDVSTNATAPKDPDE